MFFVAIKPPKHKYWDPRKLVLIPFPSILFQFIISISIRFVEMRDLLCINPMPLIPIREVSPGGWVHTIFFLKNDKTVFNKHNLNTYIPPKEKCGLLGAKHPKGTILLDLFEFGLKCHNFGSRGEDILWKWKIPVTGVYILMVYNACFFFLHIIQSIIMDITGLFFLRFC